MSAFGLYSMLSAVQISLSVVAFSLLIRAREFRTFWPMLFISNWQTIPYLTLLVARNLGHKGVINASLAYDIYFSSYWLSFALQAILAVLLTYLILVEAMRPLKGLRQLSDIIYWWTAGISFALAAGSTSRAIIQHDNVVSAVVSELQRISGTLTLGLVLLVCVAIRPMGLSLRSRVFGISVGVLLTSLVNTLQWNYLVQPRNMYRPYALVQIAVNCIAEGIWIYYFAVPEPKRKFVLLSTTSPFHQWNRIAEQFGQEPGYVAIGGIPPDAFAGAEMEVFRRASSKMTDIQGRELPKLPEGL